MLIVMVAVGVQEVAILKVIRVPFVFDGDMAAVLAVFVDVPAMGIAAHRTTPLTQGPVRNRCPYQV